MKGTVTIDTAGVDDAAKRLGKRNKTLRVNHLMNAQAK